MNLLFIACCLVYGNNRGKGWQRTWLVSCLIKTLLDILFKRVVQGIVVGFAVPNLVADDVRYVRQKLQGAGRRLLDPKKRFKLSHFSATDYCFASNILARQFPHLLESQLVLMHRDRVPERVVQRRHRTSHLWRESIFDDSHSRKGMAARVGIANDDDDDEQGGLQIFVKWLSPARLFRTTTLTFSLGTC